MNATQLSKLLSFSVQNNLPVLVKGKPGIGKSDIVSQVSDNLGYKLIISHPVVSDPTDYKGLPFVVNGGAEFLPFGELNELIKTQEPLIYFLDDFGQASPSVQAAAMQLLLARQINGHKISNEVRFIAATNRREDKAAVSGLLEPVKSRFASIVELEVSTDDWVKWALTHGMPTEIISFIQFRPELLDNFEATKEIKNSPSPRTVAFAGKMINAGVPSDLMFEAFEGAAGESFAHELTAFLKVYLTLPSIHQIKMDPLNCKIPDSVAGKFAICGAIADNMNPENIEPFVSYTERLSPEMGVMCMKNATIKHPEVCNTRTYIQWATNKANVI